MTRSIAVPVTRTVQQYAPVVLSLVAAAGFSLLLRGYLYPRPLFLLALVLSIWGHGLGPSLVGAGLATFAVRFLFPELLPAYGLVSDTIQFGLAAVAVTAFSSAKLRAEARRKLVEDQLRTSERRLMLAQSAAHLGVWDRDLRTKQIVISGEYAKLYGLPPDQRSLTNEEWLKLIHPDDRERVQELIRETLERTHVWDTEFRVVWADKSIHWLLAKGTVFLDEAGQPFQTTGVSLDITERKRAEAALRQSSDEIAHLNRVAAMGELTASLAHELNQPLAAILSNAQAAHRFLSGESHDLAQVRECLTDIVADDKRAAEVINRLRGLLKKEPFHTSVVDLNEVVDEVIRLVRNDAVARSSGACCRWRKRQRARPPDDGGLHERGHGGPLFS